VNGTTGQRVLAGVSESVEYVFVLSSFVLGTSTLIPGYRKKHGRLSCLALFACGLVCLVVLRRLDWVVPEVLTTGIGAALIAGAHALNVWFSHRCPCCRAEAEQRVTHS
jgi:hypothetical protein